MRFGDEPAPIQPPSFKEFREAQRKKHLQDLKKDPEMRKTLKLLMKETGMSEEELLAYQYAYDASPNSLDKIAFEKKEAAIEARKVAAETKRIVKNEKFILTPQQRFINKQQERLNYWNKVKAAKDAAAAKEANEDAESIDEDDRDEDRGAFNSGGRYS